MVLAALSAAFGAVLVVSGVAKLKTPDPTQIALAAFRMPSTRWAAQTVGGVEVVVGGLVPFVGGVAQLAGGALYVAFAVAVAPIVVGRVDLASCGCFGDRSTTPGYAHLVINGVGASVFFWMYISALDPLTLGLRGARVEASLGWVLTAFLYALAIVIALTRGTIRGRGADTS
ncbi:hypothetical protein BMS3Bbin02_01513 [bacterium BMS3Bbin02]|nr:hypothetical protein BMS3Bbin02_01513 [bacterium BMS3Bbin02]